MRYRNGVYNNYLIKCFSVIFYMNEKAVKDMKVNFLIHKYPTHLKLSDVM